MRTPRSTSEGIGRGLPSTCSPSRLEVPTFAEMADRHLRQMGHLALTTQADRDLLLRLGSPLREHFGSMRLKEIRKPTLLELWNLEIQGRGRADKTGPDYLDALSGVFALCVDSEILETNPVDGFRSVLRRRNRTQKGRAQNEPGANVRPIEDPGDLDTFVRESRKLGGREHLVDLSCLDAGLRLGEATGLRWSDVWWGRTLEDTTRCLTIRASRSRGEHLGPTKSGWARKVALSRRLRHALLEAWVEAGRPENGFVALVDHANHRNRHFLSVCKEAKIGKRSPKDLRDTFASQLLTAGIQLGYASRQLGHADVGITARHYARWAGGDAYRFPIKVGENEVPADLLARLRAKRPQSGHNTAEGTSGVPANN